MMVHPNGLEALHYISATRYRTELDIQLARIEVDIPFNMAGAKNLAAYLCETTRLLLMDLDLSIPTEAMQQVFELQTKSARIMKQDNSTKEFTITCYVYITSI